MYKIIIALSLSALLAGCGSTNNAMNSDVSKTNVVKANDIEKKRGAAPDGTAEKDGYICRTERPLGTRFGKKVCRTAEQIEAEKQAAKEALPRHRECAAGSICN
ncbi:hypothetical protein [Rheinheimera texasensis]|uniref:hypothetical protein n=1 Tax=Rheinheimera texasensis TaxID=306205 RepID=UPI0032B0F876